MPMPNGSTPPRGFTPKFIESLRPAEKSYEIPDPKASGLRLRVHPSGVKTFRWYVRSLNRVVSLGAWSMEPAPAHVTLAEARQWLERLKVARAAGEAQLSAVEAELKAMLQPRRAAAAPDDGAGSTVAAVAENFLRLLDGTRKRPDMARYIVAKDILPVIGHLPLRALKKSDCRAVIAKVTGRGAKVHAGKVLGLLKQMLDYAENVEDDFINPAARLKAANLEIENNARDRWLTEEEIPLFWSALEDRDARTRAALRLLLLTGVRSQELRLARWAEIDLDAGTWTIPIENQKLTLKQARQAKPFAIPIGPEARALFEELRALAGASPWVLASPEASEGHYTDKALGKAMRRLWRSHAELRDRPEATPHDLRRTARTWLGKLGILPHICERCLNHSIGRIAKVYDQGDYFEERRAALEKWDAFVRRLVAPEQTNVAFLSAAGA